MTTFYIVRHGQTDWNTEGRLQGHADIPLNATGRQQAKEVAAVLKDIKFDAVFSSDLSRARETAEAITLERNIEITTTQALREKAYGNYEGRIHAEVVKELQELFDQKEAMDDQEMLAFKIYPDGESDLEAVERFITHLREIAIGYPDKTVLIASHGGIMRYFLIKLGVTTYQKTGRQAIKNTSYLKVESDGVDFFIKDMYNIDLT